MISNYPVMFLQLRYHDLLVYFFGWYFQLIQKHVNWDWDWDHHHHHHHHHHHVIIIITTYYGDKQ